MRNFIRDLCRPHNDCQKKIATLEKRVASLENLLQTCGTMLQAAGNALTCANEKSAQNDSTEQPKSVIKPLEQNLYTTRDKQTKSKTENKELGEQLVQYKNESGHHITKREEDLLDSVKKSEDIVNQPKEYYQGLANHDEKLQKEKNHQQNELDTGQSRTDILQHENTDLKHELLAMQMQNASLQTKAQPEDFQQASVILQNVPAHFRNIVGRYYNLADTSIFLTQCGFFSRLLQCWQACQMAVIEGAEPANIAAFLELVVQRYNLAFPDNQCAEILPFAGEYYDYKLQDRVGANGSKIEKMVLPGLLNPDGSLGVKSLVILK